MYEVKVMHHCKAWRKGDLEDDFVLVDKQVFKTRTAGVDYIKSKLRGLKNVRESWHRDMTSYCYGFTGVSWVHENTGEEQDEYYQFSLKKAEVR